MDLASTLALLNTGSLRRASRNSAVQATPSADLLQSLETSAGAANLGASGRVFRPTPAPSPHLKPGWAAVFLEGIRQLRRTTGVTSPWFGVNDSRLPV